MKHKLTVTRNSAGFDPGHRFLRSAERRRLAMLRSADPAIRAERGQFLTPPPVATLLTSFFELAPGPASLLDPGSGVGTLSAAFADRWLLESDGLLSITAVEIDKACFPPLLATLDDIKHGQVNAKLVPEDFIRWAVDRIATALPFEHGPLYDYVVMNPPYQKVNAGSPERRLFMATGVEVTNLYAGFLVLGERLLKDGGQLVAITPRSFTNGPYFKAFRRDFLSNMSFRKIHLYDARDEAFADSDVLQENVIFHAYKNRSPERVVIASSAGSMDEMATVREALPEDVVRPDDPESFIFLSTDEIGADVANRMRRMSSSLVDAGLSVSTGRVVQFRARQHLRDKPDNDTAPLIYPGNISARGGIEWPSSRNRKPNAILVNNQTSNSLMPNGTYVVVKRFSAKEERRRIVAAIFDSTSAPGESVGFENHLNVFHRNGGPLDSAVAKGLATFLNSTIVDLYFRQWSGHTQVNATDLRVLRYPTLAELLSLGRVAPEDLSDVSELDRLVALHVTDLQGNNEMADSLMAHRHIVEAREALRQLDLPKPQTNERSALTMLALLDLTPERSWAEIETPMIGITPMMNFMSEHYGRRYAPNTRETVRRQSVHQFEAAGILRKNPDDPQRPTNSGKTVYQVPSQLKEALRHYGSTRWAAALASWKLAAPGLRNRWEREREMELLPVTLPDGSVVTLTPGGQNPLVKAVVEEFCPRFVGNGHLLYMGDTAHKFAVWEQSALQDIGVVVDERGKMPDLVLLDRSSDWLVLVEAVSSHGPMDSKRREELASLFADSRAGIVYVTAFPDRKTLGKYVDAISWETEVWVAETPSHLIHFDGKRFLGPYDVE